MNKRKNILSVNADSKTSKGTKYGFLTGILYLAPSDISGYNVCPMAEAAQCWLPCLYTAGRGKFSNVQQSRINKTKRFFSDRDNFMLDLIYSINTLIRKAERENLTPLVRLNGTSDINWVRFNLMKDFPNVQFYDYTKVVKNLTKSIPNYNITFSRNEANDDDCKEALKKGFNVAVVFSTKKGEELPVRWQNYPVVDGDETDVRFLDNSGSIVGLRAKGQAKKDRLGFVIKLVN